jgi:hypothetical protein
MQYQPGSSRMNAEEHGVNLWRAGDVVPAGTYLRVDDDSFRVVILEQEDRLPASYDGHVALYCRASSSGPITTRPGDRNASPRSQPAQ